MPPSFDHESVVKLFQHRPRLAAELLRALGHDVPDDLAELGSPDLSELRPIERRADLVVRYSGQGRQATAVVEIQLGPDERKRLTWPQYVCTLRASLDTDVILLVVTLDDSTARWARTPIETGHPGFRLTPLVVGPGDIPAVTDPQIASRCPELAVLSALAHVSRFDALAIVTSALTAVSGLDAPRAEMYLDIILWALHEAAPALLEAIMQQPYEFKSPFARHYYGLGREEGREEGHDSGERDLLLIQLARRFGPLPAWVAPLVTAANGDQIERWAVEIFDATTLEGLLGRAS